MKRKSQIQIGETIAVMAVFFILIAIGFIFYAKVIKGNIEHEKEESIQLKSIEIAQKAMFLPELQCSEDNIIIDNCVDSLKLSIAGTTINSNANKNYYFDLFGFSKITIKQIYPTGTGDVEIYNMIPAKYTDPSKAPKLKTNVPISIYDPSTREIYFGVMDITTYLT